MKKILSLLLFSTILALTSFAQSTTPRFGITPNQDNTGRALNYKYFTLTDATGADSVIVTPNAWQTHYRIALTDSLTLKQPVITKTYAGDNIRIIASGTPGTKVKFYGSNWKSTGTATLSTGGRAVIDFVFDGSVWVESNRVVQ